MKDSVNTALYTYKCACPDTGSASSTFAPATTHAFDLKAASEHELTVIEMQPTFPVELHMTEAQNQLLAPLLRQKQCLLDAVHHNMELAAKEYGVPFYSFPVFFMVICMKIVFYRKIK